MMKWGRKKNIETPSSSPSSSSRPSLISQAFPMSWLSRFKNVKGSSKVEEANVRGNGKKNSGSPSVVSGDRLNGGRFYGRDGDSYWSLSFRKERLEGEMGRCGLKSVRYDSDDELHALPVRTIKTTGGEASQKYDDLVLERRKARELEVLQGNFGCKAKVDGGKAELQTRRRRALKGQKSRKENRRSWEEERESQRETDEGSVNSTVSVEKDVFEVKPVRVTQATDENDQKPIVSDLRRQHSISFSNPIDLRTIKEDCIFEDLSLEQSNSFSDSELSSDWQKQKINEMMLGSVNQKISHHLSKERRRRRSKQSRKVKACSPRSALKIECKIKALEDMKRARIAMKKMTKEGAVKDATNFDSFAVVKCSVDPEEDFKDSMVEMIKEKGIKQPEELEELLACYLTLNSDEYHDLIVKVFRETIKAKNG